ncbi:glycosyltransferase [soil metagenome]
MTGRTLILTAGFGDGHNAAAYAIAEGIAEYAGENAEVCDLFEAVLPRLNRLLKWAYRSTITHLPGAWAALYHSSAEGWLANGSRRGLNRLCNPLELTLSKLRPARIISTYPVYPQLIRDISQRASAPFPGIRTLTVVTDSITVHPAWFRGRSDGYFVPDSRTATILTNRGYAPANRIFPFGFPTSPRLARSVASRRDPLIASADSPKPLRILFFPTRSRHDVIDELEVLSARLAGRAAHLTLVLGRHEKRLGPAVGEALKSLAPLSGRTTVHGWYPSAWELMLEHDLLVTKAGGATIHEALAARIPCLIDKVVPGQEEGNAALVRQIGGGIVAAPGRDGFAHALDRIFQGTPGVQPHADPLPFLRGCQAALAAHDSAGATRKIVDEALRPQEP